MKTWNCWKCTNCKYQLKHTKFTNTNEHVKNCKYPLKLSKITNTNENVKKIANTS